MAIDITAWIPIEWSDTAVQRIAQNSAVESRGRAFPMSTDTQYVLRSLDMTVGVGQTYSTDNSTNDRVLLDSQKFTGRVVVNEDDLSDANSVINTIRVKSTDWATSYAILFDNACLGVSGTSPFNSVYNVVTSAGATGEGYSANDNLVQSATGGVVSYANLSAVLAKVEQGLYFNRAEAFVIAHPVFRETFRSILDDNHRPIFVEGLAGTPDTLFSLPVQWSYGACKTSAASKAGTGNALLVVVGNSDALMRGDRTGPEVLMSTARAHEDTDETAVKFRVRKAFKVAHPKAVAVLERLA